MWDRRAAPTLQQTKKTRTSSDLSAATPDQKPTRPASTVVKHSARQWRMPKDPTAHKGRRRKNPVAQEVKSVVAPLPSAKLSQQLLENGQGFQRYESMDTAFGLAELLGFVSCVASSSFSRTFPQAAKSMLTSGQKLVSGNGLVPCLGIATSAQKHIDYSFSTALGSKASVTPCFFGGLDATPTCRSWRRDTVLFHSVLFSVQVASVFTTHFFASPSFSRTFDRE